MNNYEDIIGLRHHTSRTHPRMLTADRAAQFAAFAALTGLGAAMSETSRLTDEKKDIDEYRKEIISRKIWFVKNMTGNIPVVKIRYFIPDSRKKGGSYITGVYRVKLVDEYRKAIVTCEGNTIPFDCIHNIKILSFEMKSGVTFRN